MSQFEWYSVSFIWKMFQLSESLSRRIVIQILIFEQRENSTLQGGRELRHSTMQTTDDSKLDIQRYSTPSSRIVYMGNVWRFRPLAPTMVPSRTTGRYAMASKIHGIEHTSSVRSHTLG